jgi:hypothetical protein
MRLHYPLPDTSISQAESDASSAEDSWESRQPPSAAALARRSLLVQWDQIGSISAGRIELTAAAAELQRLGDESDD